MYVLFETVEYFDGTRTAQICGTYTSRENACDAMRKLHDDELASDEEYSSECSEVTDDYAICSGDDGLFPRLMTWYILDTVDRKVVTM